MPVEKDRKGKWVWSNGGHYMEASCHHHRFNNGACGGCYARAVETLALIAEKHATPEAVSFIEEVRSEKPAPR
jgi:hypothetical protein